mmetsp:Transcript_11543/g.21853  ORF Transcript_11543/g.21853 Transcript_11543/m.21853 type:complete len:230 (+) Transcript_11543:58-747(+)
MSGLRRIGEDANPFGSKFQATSGGFDAGNGQRTYTKPSYTLFVTGIPDAESSDAVEAVFSLDRGFLQCRPVGHKARRMVFVDYDSIEQATQAMQSHQGFKWEDVDEGLKIDYDQDARCKRNTALDQGIYDKFYPIAVRKPRLETEAELFARLRDEADHNSKPPLKARKTQKQDAKGPAAQIHVKTKASETASRVLQDVHGAEQTAVSCASALVSALVSYPSDSESEGKD